MSQLLASSATESGVIGLINRFYYSNSITLHGEDVYNSNGKIEGVRVVKKKGRYRFEMI